MIPAQETMLEAQRLLDAWDRLGRSHMMIGAGCSCGIGGIAVALEDFEQDIVDYLQGDAERLNRHDVLEYLAEHCREGELWSVSRLLAGLTQPCDPDAGAFLLERLARTLQSFERLHGSA
jgi:hypothetical protein